MRVLKGTLTFILGMIVGILLFVLAIGGAVFAAGTLVTVGDLQNKVGLEFIRDDSEAYNKTMLDVVKDVIADAKEFDKISINSLISKYGLPIPKEVMGLDISKAYEYPLTEIGNHTGEIINSIPLRDIGDVAGINWDDIKFPIVKDNLDLGVSDAISKIAGSMDGNLTISSIKDKFGIDIGIDDNIILKKIQYAALSEFGSLLNVLELNDLLDAKTDTYLLFGPNDLYYFADAYEKVSTADLKDAAFVPALGVQTYAAKAIDTDADDKADTLVERELRFIKKDDGTYAVDNSCYEDDFDADATDKEFYRHVEYKKYEGGSEITEFYVKSYADKVVSVSGINYELKFKGFVKLQEITDSATSKYVRMGNRANISEDGTGLSYGIIDSPITLNSKLSSDGSGYVLLAEGTSTKILSSIAYKSLADLQNDDSFIEDMKIGDIITIDETSSTIVKSLDKKGTKIKDLSTVTDSLKLYEMIDIKTYTYQEDANGLYIKVNILDAELNPTGDFYYTLYNPATYSGELRYNIIDKTDASSKILQRLMNVKLGDFSNAIDELLLSDVLDITPDIYKKVTYTLKTELDPNTRYYYYDDVKNIYLVADDDYLDTHNEVFKVEINGKDSKVLRKLAYIKVNDLSSSIQTVIDNMFLSEIINIVDTYAVGFVSGTATNDDEKFFIEDTDADGIVYIYDGNGRYVKRGYSFKPATAADLSTYYISSTTIGYESVDNTPSSPHYVVDHALKYNLFYNNGTAFIYKPQLASYLLGKGEITDLAYCAIGTGSIPVEIYDNTLGNLFVEILGDYVLYDNTNPVHVALQDKMFIKEVGDCFVDIGAPVPVEWIETAGKYVPTDLDANYRYRKGIDVLFSKQYAENVYVASNTGDYVYVDEEYIAFDPAVHGSEQRYTIKSGYITSTSGAYYKVSSTYNTDIAPQKVEIINDKSSKVLITLGVTTIGKLNESISNATLEDLMDIDPDSLFNELRTYKIDELSSAMTTLLTSNTVTIGKLLAWGNIHTVDANVKDALNNITLPKFFESLEFNPQSGIIVNMVTLYAE